MNQNNRTLDLALPPQPSARQPGWRILRKVARHAGINQPFGYWKRRKVAAGLIALVHIPIVFAVSSTNPLAAILLGFTMLLWMDLMARTRTLRGWTVRLPAESIADLLHIVVPVTPALLLIFIITDQPLWPVLATALLTFLALTGQALFWRGRPKSWVRILGSPSNLGASVNTFGQCMDLLGRDGCRFAPFRADKPEPEAWERRITAWLERGETVLVLEPRLHDLARKLQARGDVLIADDCLLFTAFRRRAGRKMNFLLGVFNKFLALVMVLTLWPVGLAIALAIKLDDGGPILFRQKRIGKRGRVFTIYKFRTMSMEAPDYEVHPDDGDERITRVGRWLRRLSLDEFPQFINVARGEMRIVGPRPEMPFIVSKYNDIQRERLRVKPGITGLWQVSPHRNDPIHEHLEYDLAYIAHRGPILDLALVIATAGLAKSTGR